MRGIALVKDLGVVGRVAARGALYRSLHLVLGHVDRAGVLDDAAQRRIAAGVTAPGFHRDGDFLADLGELFRHAIPAGEHRVLADFENSAHGPLSPVEVANDK